MKILFPGIISNPKELYKELSQDFTKLNNLINGRIEEDIALRSNFEFSSQNKNLLKDKNFDKKIQQGIAILRNLNLISADIEQNIRSNLSLILKM
jgi:hypothetical protein